jgi:hypothetical protein
MVFDLASARVVNINNIKPDLKYELYYFVN